MERDCWPGSDVILGALYSTKRLPIQLGKGQSISVVDIEVVHTVVTYLGFQGESFEAQQKAAVTRDVDSINTIHIIPVI